MRSFIHRCSQKASEIPSEFELGNGSPHRFGELEKDDLVAFIG